MKTFKNCLAAILVSVISLFSDGQAQARITDENQQKINQLSAMMDALRASGVQSFVSQCGEKGWTCPKIFSTWYIVHLPDDPEGLKQVEKAKSNLGLDLARQLSVVAMTVRETNESATLEKASDTLFATAKWIGTEVGYGNLILQDRAYDIASVAAVKFMADLTYPMGKAEAAMKRFDDKWSSVPNRRLALFEESGGTHFKKIYSNNEVDALTKEWQEGVALAMDAENVARKPDLEIFVLSEILQDESYGIPETTWQRKDHHRIGINALVNMNLRDLESLREFRKRYGKFPTKPDKYVKGETESDIQAAFWELSWENPYGVQAAYMVYEQYVSGRLADKGWNDLRDRSKVGPQPSR